MFVNFKHFVGTCWFLGWFRLRLQDLQDCKLPISADFLLVNHPSCSIPSAGWDGLDRDVANLGVSSLTYAGSRHSMLAFHHQRAICLFRAHRELSIWTHRGKMWRHSKAVVRSKAVRAAIPVGYGTADKQRCWPLSNALLTSLEGGGFTFVRWTIACWRQESPWHSFGKTTHSHKSKDNMFALQHRQQLWFEY